MIKKSYSVQMAYNVSDQEKEKAEKTLLSLDILLNSLEGAEKHLDLMYIPFKENTETDSKQIFKARSSLRSYRDKCIENFNKFKKNAFISFTLLQTFSSDTQVVKLIKSFTLAIDDLEKQANRFFDLFEDLNSSDFSKNIVNAIESIIKESAQLKQIIEDRIKSHIQSNILARNWVDLVSEELQAKVEKRTPLVQKLIEERENTINKSIK